MHFDPQFLDNLSKVREAILISLGPDGKGVLVSRKSPREMFITKSGKEILETFKGSHPFLDIIISSIRDMTRVTGEGAKRTFLTIDGVIRLLAENKEDFTRQELVSLARLSFGIQTPPDTWTMTSSYNSSHTSSSILNSIESSVKFNLSSRLPSSITSVLIPLLKSFIHLHIDGANNIAEAMDSLVSIMPSLVTQVYNRPVHDSSIGEGVLIQSDLSIPSKKLNYTDHRKSANLNILFLNNMEGHKGDDKVTVQLCGSHSKHIKHFNEDFLANRTTSELVRNGVDLVISSRGMSPGLKQSLSQEGIAVMEYIGDQETKEICSLLKLTPWTLRDSILPANICQAEQVECVDVGGQPMTRIVPCHRLHHIIVCGVTKQLSSQYSQALLDSVKCARLVIRDIGENGKKIVETSANNPQSPANDLQRLVENCLHSYSMTFETVSLEKTISKCVSSTLFSLIRIERICFTTKRIHAVDKSKKQSKLGYHSDSEDDFE